MLHLPGQDPQHGPTHDHQNRRRRNHFEENLMTCPNCSDEMVQPNHRHDDRICPSCGYAE